MVSNDNFLKNLQAFYNGSAELQSGDKFCNCKFFGGEIYSWLVFGDCIVNPVAKDSFFTGVYNNLNLPLVYQTLSQY